MIRPSKKAVVYKFFQETTHPWQKVRGINLATLRQSGKMASSKQSKSEQFWKDWCSRIGNLSLNQLSKTKSLKRRKLISDFSTNFLVPSPLILFRTLKDFLLIALANFFAVLIISFASNYLCHQNFHYFSKFFLLQKFQDDYIFFSDIFSRRQQF